MGGECALQSEHERRELAEDADEEKRAEKRGQVPVPGGAAWEA